MSGSLLAPPGAAAASCCCLQAGCAGCSGSRSADLNPALYVLLHITTGSASAQARRSRSRSDTQSRAGEDGQLYYDIVSRVKSFASRQQLAVNVAEREEAIVMEYDRVLINTLGTANKRLYQLRIQTPYSRYTKEGVSYATMLDSFRTKEVVL